MSLLSSLPCADRVQNKARRARSVDGLIVQLLARDRDLHRPCLVRKSLIVLTRYIDGSDGSKTSGAGLGCRSGSLRCSPLGVWRSLVARSVRVGEVPSSNLGTPIDRGKPCFPRHPLLPLRPAAPF